MTEKLWTTDHLVQIAFTGGIQLATDHNFHKSKMYSRKNIFYIAPPELQILNNAVTLLLLPEQKDVLPIQRFLPLNEDQVTAIREIVPWLELAIQLPNKLSRANVAIYVGMVNAIVDKFFILRPMPVAFPAGV